MKNVCTLMLIALCVAGLLFGVVGCAQVNPTEPTEAPTVPAGPTEPVVDTEQLNAAKDAAKAELDAYANPADYRDAQKTELSEAIEAGKAAIDAAANVEAVNAAATAAKAAIDAIETDAELTAKEEAAAAALAEAKTAANAELDTYVDAKYYLDEQKVKLDAAIEAGKTAIDAAADVDAVNTALTAAKTAIDAIEKSYMDVTLTFVDASNGYLFTSENAEALLSTYNAWKKLNVPVQVQSGKSGVEAVAAELKEVNAFFNLSEDGTLYLYGADEYVGIQMVIPAGTVITPANDAGSITKMHITNDIILGRDASNWGYNTGWEVREEIVQPERYIDVELTFKNASNGFVFTTENGASLRNTYGAWKKLNVTVQAQFGNSADEAAAAELKEVEVFFNIDDSGNLCLYSARESKGVQLVIPAGTIITPAADAGSTVKLRITNEIILVRNASNYGTTSGWALKGETSEEEPPTEEPPVEETYTDVELTFKNASSGYMFTTENSANLLATYGAWKKLNVTVQEQYGNSSAEAEAAELKELEVFFNLDDSGNLCLFGAHEYKAVKLVIPAGTIITPADNSTKLRITNEIVLVRDASNYGTTNGWAVKSETTEEEPPTEETYTDIVLTFKNASSGYTFTAEDSANLLATYGAWKKLNVTVQEQYGNSADEAAAAELKEKAVFFNLDDSGNFCLFGANEYKAVKLVIPAGTIITPADNSTKLRITNEIVLVRDSTNYGTVNGWQMQ